MLDVKLSDAGLLPRPDTTGLVVATGAVDCTGSGAGCTADADAVDWRGTYPTLSGVQKVLVLPARPLNQVSLSLYFHVNFPSGAYSPSTL